MEVHFISYYVRRLNDRLSTLSLGRYLRNFQPSVDIYHIQEHKLHLDKVNKVGDLLRRHYKCKILDAEAGEENTLSAGRGRVCTLIKTSIAKHICEEGIVCVNKLQWLQLLGLLGGSYRSRKSMCLIKCMRG